MLDAIAETDVTIMGASLGGLPSLNLAETNKWWVGRGFQTSSKRVSIPCPRSAWGVLEWVIRHKMYVCDAAAVKKLDDCKIADINLKSRRICWQSVRQRTALCTGAIYQGVGCFDQCPQPPHLRLMTAREAA